MNVLKFTPGGMPFLASADSPVPRTNRNSTGWMSDVMARSRSRRNLMSSRRHTMLVGPQIRAQAAFGNGDPDLVGQDARLGRGRSAGRPRLSRHGHRLPRKRAAIWRMASVPVASASRMVVPV